MDFHSVLLLFSALMDKKIHSLKDMQNFYKSRSHQICNRSLLWAFFPHFLKLA